MHSLRRPPAARACVRRSKLKNRRDPHGHSQTFFGTALDRPVPPQRWALERDTAWKSRVAQDVLRDCVELSPTCAARMDRAGHAAAFLMDAVTDAFCASRLFWSGDGVAQSMIVGARGGICSHARSAAVCGLVAGGAPTLTHCSSCPGRTQRTPSWPSAGPPHPPARSRTQCWIAGHSASFLRHDQVISN